MNTFQNYVFVTTLFCLLVALTITAIVLKTHNSGSYPPSVDSCPDYWYNSYYDIDSSNNSVSTCSGTTYGCCPDNKTPKSDDTGSTCPTSKCYNVKNLGKGGDMCNREMDFSKFSICQKQSWAKGCNITWDGITNIPTAC
jgi:hypothetical protein